MEVNQKWRLVNEMTKNVPTDVFKRVNMHGGDKDVCWEWEGTVNKSDGRPYITIEGKRRPTYVVVLELSSGETQEEASKRLGKKALACHKCDNKICNNPSDLYWGTHQDNMDDMVERDRHGLSKVIIRNIRKLLSEGRSHSNIAELYGISRENVTAINNNRTRKYRETE